MLFYLLVINTNITLTSKRSRPTDGYPSEGREIQLVEILCAKNQLKGMRNPTMYHSPLSDLWFRRDASTDRQTDRQT